MLQPFHFCKLTLHPNPSDLFRSFKHPGLWNFIVWDSDRIFSCYTFSFIPKKKKKILSFSPQLSQSYTPPRLSRFLSFLCRLSLDSLLPPPSPRCLRPQSSPCVFSLSFHPSRSIPRASPPHPYLSNLPVELLSLWEHDLQPSNSRLYTAAFSSCSQSSLWSLHTRLRIQSARSFNRTWACIQNHLES